MPRTVNFNAPQDRRGPRWPLGRGKAEPETVEPTPPAFDPSRLQTHEEVATSETATVAEIAEPEAEIALGSIATDTPDFAETVESAIPTIAAEAVVGPDGSVNFDQLFREARLPSVPLSSEQAAQILSRIPTDLPQRVRRLALKTALDILNLSEQEATAAIVQDAANKMVHIARLQESVNAEIAGRRQETNDAIQALEAQIAAHRAMLAEAEQRYEATQLACRQRTDELSEVLHFFDQPETPTSGGGGDSSFVLSNGHAEHDPTEMPAYLREDSVLRLLGLPAVDPANDNEYEHIGVA